MFTGSRSDVVAQIRKQTTVHNKRSTMDIGILSLLMCRTATGQKEVLKIQACELRVLQGFLCFFLNSMFQRSRGGPGRPRHQIDPIREKVEIPIF